MKRCTFLLVLFSLICSVSELSATVTTRHYDFEEGAAGGGAGRDLSKNESNNRTDRNIQNALSLGENGQIG